MPVKDKSVLRYGSAAVRSGIDGVGFLARKDRKGTHTRHDSREWKAETTIRAFLAYQHSITADTSVNLLFCAFPRIRPYAIHPDRQTLLSAVHTVTIFQVS